MGVFNDVKQISEPDSLKKVQSVIDDYNLEAEVKNIEELAKDFKNNSLLIVQLQGKIEKEMKAMVDSIKELEEKSI